MIKFEKITLNNGLKVIIHHDNSSPFVTLNLLYNVGSRDEDPERTGFAHLFEHLMFGGSVNIPTYDKHSQIVGGEHNAFTTPDFTNYYITLPKENIETAFWLESDRMFGLSFSPKSLETQRSVVIEEFKQRYLNQPYGDVMLLLRPLAYKKHSYQWPTIGKNIKHIEEATMDDVKDFFYKHYNPENAILSVAGDVTTEEIKTLAEKWFGEIETKHTPEKSIPIEEPQTEERKLSVTRDVPINAIYKAFHVGGRNDDDYHTLDLICDILSNGKSSRFYQNLVRDKKLFSYIECYNSGSIDPGLLMISGQLIDGVDMDTAEKAINEELKIIKEQAVSDYELNKVKNKIESTLVFAEMSPISKSLHLAFHELLDDANDVNNQVEKYLKVTKDDITNIANKILKSDNCSTLYYNKNIPQ